MNGFAPVTLNKAKLSLCPSCTTRKLPRSADMMIKCNSCTNSVVSGLKHCAKCSSTNNRCQVCGAAKQQQTAGLLVKKSWDAVKNDTTTGKTVSRRQVLASPAQSPRGSSKRKPGSRKISLIDFLTEQGKASSDSWEDALVRQADSVTEGNGVRDLKAERACIRRSYSKRIDPEERRQMAALLSDHGYGKKTQDLAIGEIFSLATEK